MSTKAQITSRQEYKTDAKFMKLEKIDWKDEDGKEVRLLREALHTYVIELMER